MAKTKAKRKTRQSLKLGKSIKSEREIEIFMILSLTQCNIYIIIYQFQLSKPKKVINKFSNCNNWPPVSDSSS